MSDIVRDTVVGRAQQHHVRVRTILRLVAIVAATLVVALVGAAALAPSDGAEILTAASGRW